MFALPRITAPASKARASPRRLLSRSAPAKSRSRPWSGTPATSMLSLTTSGIPSSGSGSPRALRRRPPRGPARARAPRDRDHRVHAPRAPSSRSRNASASSTAGTPLRSAGSSTSARISSSVTPPPRWRRAHGGRRPRPPRCSRSLQGRAVSAEPSRSVAATASSIHARGPQRGFVVARAGRASRASCAAERIVAIGIGDALAGDVGRGAVGGLEEAVLRRRCRAEGARPRPPTVPAPRSERMSPNMFSVTSDVECRGPLHQVERAGVDVDRLEGDVGVPRGDLVEDLAEEGVRARARSPCRRR